MKKKILDIANRVFNHAVDTDSKINDFESWDSLGQLTLFMALESELKIKFTHDEIIEMSSINKILDLLENKYFLFKSR
jgi:acyl carrier protein